MPDKKIPGDRLVLALISVFRTLVGELVKKGIIERDELIFVLQQTAIAHRESGDVNNLAEAIHALSLHLDSSLPESPVSKSTVRRLKKSKRKKRKSTIPRSRK